MEKLLPLVAVSWALTIGTLVFALIACWRRREVGLYILTLNLGLFAVERLAQSFGADVYFYMRQFGSATPMLIGFAHSTISLLGWLLLALNKNAKKA